MPVCAARRSAAPSQVVVLAGREEAAGQRAVAAGLFAAGRHDGHHGLVALHGEDRRVDADGDRSAAEAACKCDFGCSALVCWRAGRSMKASIKIKALGARRRSWQFSGAARARIRSLAAAGALRARSVRMVGGDREGDRFAGGDAAADASRRRHHAALAAERRVGEPDHQAVGIGGRRGLAQPRGDQFLGCIGIDGAQRRVGGSRRAADAGPAVHDDRPAAAPVRARTRSAGRCARCRARRSRPAARRCRGCESGCAGRAGSAAASRRTISSCSQVSRCEALLRATVWGTALSGHTWMAPSLRRARACSLPRLVCSMSSVLVGRWRGADGTRAERPAAIPATGSWTAHRSGPGTAAWASATDTASSASSRWRSGSGTPRGTPK